MTPEDLQRFFDKHPQFDRPEWHALVRPCIKIVFATSRTTDGSRWGGTPYLPQDFQAPKTDLGGKYRFMGQLNFGDFSHLVAPAIPKTGLLSLFVNDDDDAFWGDDGYVKAFYFADTTDFVLHDDKDAGTPSQGIRFTQGVSLPCNSYFELDYPEDVEAFYDKFYDTFDDIADHLFGYPTNDSLGYDPTPEGYLPLLSVSSHDELNWCWHDGDRLMLFIEPSALADGNFNNIKADAG